MTLEDMRGDSALADMVVLKRGNRLSITPVDARHWRHILKVLAYAPR
jgi:predicted RNA-binding protein with PUA-like domain